MKTEQMSIEDINFIVRALEKRADVLSEMADLAKTGEAKEAYLRGVRRYRELAGQVRVNGLPVSMDSGLALICEERQRQITQEGWTEAHDDEHVRGELAMAAACYAAPAQIFVEMSEFVDAWPWEPQWDKRGKHSRLRCLTIAGALIAAEIDRLKRAGE